MAKKIIVISGKQYCGKDTVAKILLNNLSSFTRIGIGDAIKLEYGKEHNLTFEQIEKEKHLYRTGLIELGNWGRAQDPDYWLKKLIDFNGDIIVPDIRVEHEAELFKAHGAYLLRVEATYEARSLRGTITNANDHTEVALDNYKGLNYIIDNSKDYKALEIAAKSLIEDIKKYFNLRP